MSLSTNVQDLAIEVATEIKRARLLLNGNQADLSALQTTAKTNLVAAINELVGAAGGAGASIDDTGTSSVSVWSSSHTQSQITAAVNALVDAAPGALDTLNELAAALGDDADFANTITNLVNSRTAQATTEARGTVELATAAEVQAGTDDQRVVTPAALRAVTGDLEVDLVAVFQAGLV